MKQFYHSSHQHQRKCMENSEENMNADIRAENVNIIVILIT